MVIDYFWISSHKLRVKIDSLPNFDQINHKACHDLFGDEDISIPVKKGVV
tara:strand:+ start:25290 stop:25439 length:150 start_codon:yes stop_codon:yes gene_type:complete